MSSSTTPSGGGAGEAAGAAAVDELERAAPGADRLANRRDDPRQARADVALGGRLHRADLGRAQRLAGDPVADPGDLSLIGHQPGEPGARAILDLAAIRRARAASWTGERFGPIRATRPPSGHQPTIDVEADPDLRRPAADRALDQVEVGPVVDHQHRRALRRLGGEPRDLGDRAAVDRRVGDDEVVEAPCSAR